MTAIAVGLLPRLRSVDLDLRSSPAQLLLAELGASRLAGVRLAGITNPAPESHRATLAEQRVIARELRLLRHDSAPRSLGTLGVLHLVVGRYDAAVHALEQASRLGPSDPSLRTDLDAALLARGRMLDSPLDLVRSLDQIGQEPLALESSYNRALALQSLFLYRLAKIAWQQYLERDPTSPWRQLASEHLRILTAGQHPPIHRGRDVKGTTAPPVWSSRPEEIQTWLDDTGLAAWSSAVLGRKESARRAAERRIEQAAMRIADLSGDRFFADEVSALSAAPTTHLPSLAAGLRDYSEAKDWLDRYAFERALSLFERATKRLRSTSSPHLWRAEAGIAQCQVQLERYGAARRTVERVLAAVRRKRYVAIEAPCAWVLTQISLATLDLHSAQQQANAFFELNRRARNRTGTAAASLLLARVEDELGNPRAGWLHRLHGFRDLAEDGSDERLALAVGNASFALARERQVHAAVDFASEALAFDRQQRSPLGIVESLWIRATHRARAREVNEALADVREAESYLPAVESSANRERLLAGLRAVKGGLLARSEPRAAIIQLDEALGFLRHRGYEYGQAEILLDRSRALLHLGRPGAALADLDQAALIVAVQRERIKQPLLQVSFSNLQAELEDERVAASLRLDPLGRQAFWAADQARGLLFRNGLGLAPFRLSSRQLASSRRTSQISDTDAVLSYWSLPDSLLIWTMRRGGSPRLVVVDISRARLSQQIADFVSEMEANADSRTVATLAQILSKSLIAPVAGELTGVRRLIVVPDRIVRSVPWPALVLGPGNRSLLQHFVIRICPAIGILDALADRPRGNAGELTSLRLLAIGDPKLTAPEHTTQPDLPGARREVEAIARLFAEHMTLMGPEANRERFLKDLQRASIVHIASHFTTGSEPGASHIELAKSAGEATAGLDAEAIARLALPHLRLAVLSGCSTDREAEPSVEGTFAGAGSFLAAGATEVVATLWPIDDGAAVELMVRFYREVLAGKQADEALRSAQLALGGGAGGTMREPASWAAFQLVSLHSRGRESIHEKELR